MSNYRRLISYIYAYEGGVKGKNTGYAKIEVRGDQCRIQANVKKVFVGSNDIGVYLLSPGREILLGKIFIRGGNGEFRIQVASGNVEASGYGIDQCYGLTIHDVESTWQCYTTIWEDAVAQAAEIQLEHVTAENVRKQQEQSEKTEEKNETEKEKNEPLPISAEIERQLKAEEERLKDVQPWEIEEAETEQQTEAEMVQQTEKETVMPQQAEEQQPENQPKMAQRQTPQPEPASPADACQPENPELLKSLEKQEQEAKNRMNSGGLWSRLQRTYSKVLAFDYDHGCEILSIKPQDIGLLPREIWVYGNNSFLLHGYYNYRHLILARLNTSEGGSRYLLGVPGHYYSNEKYMASMFGFPHFVLARKQPEEDGRFGYWYTDIRL